MRPKLTFVTVTLESIKEPGTVTALFPFLRGCQFTNRSGDKKGWQWIGMTIHIDICREPIGLFQKALTNQDRPILTGPACMVQHDPQVRRLTCPDPSHVAQPLGSGPCMIATVIAEVERQVFGSHCEIRTPLPFRPETAGQAACERFGLTAGGGPVKFQLTTSIGVNIPDVVLVSQIEF